ncbi:hypothetical protein LCI18_002956 [Fusarium solani-melongenae]|uniref:Uncharacterized protein n=1 Tax=Fusarium solani subsp. cucurbitae TaxID=2747967 RepID=A0ACD3YSU6_FUSSC|nr:hypothetical protein LCI18_002956 [Fusarium solani-melongenae]
MMSMIGAWEYGVTPSLEASERWSESLVLRLSNVLGQDDMRFKKAYPRYCMMIAMFRGASLFQEQQIFVQDDSEDMIPTSWLIREKFKR